MPSLPYRLAIEGSCGHWLVLILCSTECNDDDDDDVRGVDFRGTVYAVLQGSIVLNALLVGNVFAWRS
jgi:hypothetical protein